MARPSYADFVRLRTRGNPCLQGLSQYLDKPGCSESRIVLIDCPHNELEHRLPELQLVTAKDCMVLATTTPPKFNRLLLIEDISPDLIIRLGEVFDIDPLFFADYVCTDFQDLEKKPPPPSLAILPSLISTRPYLHLHYQQILDLGDPDAFAESSYALKTDSNISRNVRRLAPLSNRQLALARASCSIFLKRTESSSIDRPIKHVVEAHGTKREHIHQARPMHSGFEDFEPTPPFSSFSKNQKHQVWDKGSMLESILHYLQNQLSPSFHTPCPAVLDLGYYPTRIVLAEWNLYIHLTSRFSKYYEYSLRDMNRRLHDIDIVDLQRWRRRCKKSRHKLALLADYIDHHSKYEDDQEPWRLSLKDIEYLRQQLYDYSQSLEQMVTVATSMVQLIDSRRSILEAVSVRRLTYIALIFIPLAWVASLFSMSDEFLPGEKYFWVYFVTALPILVLVVILSALSYEGILQTVTGLGEKLSRASNNLTVSKMGV
ncbi:hypothetical protein FGRMN_4151 [Fusarium graminum]|nr:hypothetical protein FGRMN_4151 [Fusarium graminum]